MWLMLLACAPLPEVPADLYGAWANTDEEGTVRVLEFAASLDEPPELASLSEVYRIWNYPAGAEPTLAQAGVYELVEEYVVTTPAPAGGLSYSNLMLGFRDGRWLELEVDKDTGESRRYEAVDAPP